VNTPLIVLPHARTGSHAAAVRTGVRLEQLTIVWMAAEAIIALWAGAAARSGLLTAFGLDSVIELVSGGVLLWRLSVDAGGGRLDRVDRAERTAAWIVSGSLALLCAYIVVTAAWTLLAGMKPEGSIPGLAIAIAAVIGMPFLARAKRRVAARIDSAALRGDAACSLTCAAMAGALLAGLGLHLVFGWWWAEPLAAFGFLYWLIPETRAAFRAARSGRVGCCGCCATER
jgi:divalent metal cation (Fe/Co/Zn/Cd) transporter